MISLENCSNVSFITPESRMFILLNVYKIYKMDENIEVHINISIIFYSLLNK
jgi:hypothetical protein